MVEIRTNPAFEHGLVVARLNGRNRPRAEIYRSSLVHDDGLAIAQQSGEARLKTCRQFWQVLEKYSAGQGFVQPAAAGDALECSPLHAAAAPALRAVPEQL